MNKLQGAINKITLEKPSYWYFKVAQLKKAIGAIKEHPNLDPEEAIKLKFKNPDGILKKVTWKVYSDEISARSGDRTCEGKHIKKQGNHKHQSIEKAHKFTDQCAKARTQNA